MFVKLMFLGSQEVSPLTYARMMMMLFGHSRGQVKTFLHLGLGSPVVSHRLVRAKKNVLILAKNLAV